MSPSRQFLETIVALGKARQLGLAAGFAIVNQYCGACRRWQDHTVYQYSIAASFAETIECNTCGHREFQPVAAKTLSNGSQGS